MDIIKLKAMLTDEWASEPLYITALDLINFKIVDKIPSMAPGLTSPPACVFYKNKKFNILLQEKYTNIKEIACFLVKHELWHIFLGHLSNRWLTELLLDKEHNKANIAMDIAIHENISIPMEKLLKNKIAPATAMSFNFKLNQTTEYYFNQMKKQGKGKGRAVSPDVFIVEAQAEDAVKELLDNVKKKIGQLPANLVRAIKRENGINVEKLLNVMENAIDPTGRRGIKKTWCRPNRRNKCFRGKIKIGKIKLALILDTSGSVTEKMLNQMAGALYKLKEYCVIFVMPTDTEVHNPYWFKGHFNSIKGGGGTDFNSAFQMAEDMGFKSLIVLTDGACDYPSTTTMKVTWGIVEGEMEPNFGKVVYL